MSLLFIFFSLLFLLSPAESQTALLAPINKDNTTLLYAVTVYLKTPLQPTKLLLHLGSSFSWVDCYQNYDSTTIQHIPCDSPLCNSFSSSVCGKCADPPGTACTTNSTANATATACSLYPENPITRQATIANAIMDSLALPSTDGSHPRQLGLMPEFVFSCSKSFLRKGLADNVAGLAAFGRSNNSLPAQVSDFFSSPRYFALCLSASTGVAFLGTSGPYYLSSNVDVSKLLLYTPLILNPVGNTVITSVQQPSDEYYINLTSIKVNGKAIQFNDSGRLLSIDENGNGGTKMSTINPYTALESTIYKAFVEAFVNESSGLNLTVTSPVKPFDVCYEASAIVMTRVGPGVPTVDLVMESEDVLWRIFGWNSMVRIVNDAVDVWCLGFVNGGFNARTSIVIGGHQMEDNLLQFDLESKRLGFSSSILLQGTNCANFNFNSSFDKLHT